MDVKKGKIAGSYIIEPDCYGDHRGWFMETFNEAKYKDLGIESIFLQSNMSFTAKQGTIRGLHYQKDPVSQAKLVRCVSGIVLDVCVDLRKGSPTHLQWEAVELSLENKRQLYIPRGCAHGFLTKTDNVLFEYNVDNPYSKEYEGGIRYDDPTINVNWNGLLDGIKPILSEKDTTAPLLEDANCNFVFHGDK